MNFRKLGAAFAIALVVSGLCTISLSRKIAANATARKSGRHYVVSARTLNVNEVLKSDSLTQVDWPQDVEIAGAFTKPADLVGRTVLYPIDKGQPLTEKLVSAPGAGSGLAGRIPDGMRAIALRTDEVMGVAGFLMPGSRLDVLATYHANNSPEPSTVTVLQNAEVLAAGHQTEPDPDGKPSTVTVVTLLLSPEDAEKAVLASTQGTIHFVLRSGSDEKVSNNAPVLMSELTGDTGARIVAPAHEAMARKPAVRLEKRAAKPNPQVYTVQMILGERDVTNTFPVVPR